MKIISLLFVLISASAVAASELQVQKQLTLEARAETKKLGGALKRVLKKQMKRAGPVAAVEACRLEAPQISQKLSSGSEWQVGRTSLKVRNPTNTPDSWEQKVLQFFEQQLKAGVNPAALEFSEIITTEDSHQFRYMKAIGTKKVCMVCHGGDIASPVKQKIDLLYPTDKAVGYKKGDLRGAFTLSKTIP